MILFNIYAIILLLFIFIFNYYLRNNLIMKFKFVYLNFSFINITFISLSLDSGQHSTHIPLWIEVCKIAKF